MMSGYKIEDSNNYTNSITSSNDSVVLSTSSPISEAIQGNNSKDTFEDNESNKWPDWAKSVQCISHVLLTFYSSVTFLIYYVKQKNIGRRGKWKNYAQVQNYSSTYILYNIFTI